MEQNGILYYNIFKSLFLYEVHCIFIQISQQFVPKYPVDK